MTENQQHPRFNHEEWLNGIFQFIETAKQFTFDFFQAVKSMLQKGLGETWKEIRSASTKLSTIDFLFAGTMLFIGALGGFFLLAGIVLLSYQSLLWLQSGVWTEYPLLTVFNFLFKNTALHQWMVNPESWIGMQKMILWFLESIPISLALMIPGFSIAFMAAGIFTAALIFRFYQLKNM